MQVAYKRRWCRAREPRGESKGKAKEAERRRVYGSEISDARCMDVDDYTARTAAMAKELEQMRRRLQNMDAEAAAAQERISEEMAAIQAPQENKMEVDSRSIYVGNDSCLAPQENKMEVDSRSIYVGNVDYACAPEEVQQHFQLCGTINRVTIPLDTFGQPKGYAYLEFLETEAVQKALHLNETELHGRLIKVAAKRTNIPGMKRTRPRRFFFPYMGYTYGRPYMPRHIAFADGE